MIGDERYEGTVTTHFCDTDRRLVRWLMGLSSAAVIASVSCLGVLMTGQARMEERLISLKEDVQEAKMERYTASDAAKDWRAQGQLDSAQKERQDGFDRRLLRVEQKLFNE